MNDMMYFAVQGSAITLDEFGTPVICDLNDDGSIDWDTMDCIEWMDLDPDTYQLYKSAVDFLQDNIKFFAIS